MIPMILMAIEDDADRAFMINLYEQCHKAMYRQPRIFCVTTARPRMPCRIPSSSSLAAWRPCAPCPRASCCRMPLLRPKARR